jgi:hypothetical protein
MLEASAHLGTRQFGKAMDTVLDAFHLAGDISRGAPLICHLVTINLQAIARQQAWAVIPHLSAPDAHRAVRRLERILTAAMPLEDVLREEASYAFASLEFLTQSPAHLRWSIEADVGKLDLTDAELLATYGPHVETCARALAEMANAFIGSLRRPYPARVAPDPPANPLLHGTCATWGETVFRSTVSTAQNRLLLAALALRAWHATHGKFPDSLQALCPSCLSAVPVDPFSDGEPLCYKSGGNAYLLYNRGPDGKDDGGARIQHGVGDAASADQVTPRSMGDMVAGIELNAVTPYMAAYLERIMANPPPSG